MTSHRRNKSLILHFEYNADFATRMALFPVKKHGEYYYNSYRYTSYYIAFITQGQAFYYYGLQTIKKGRSRVEAAPFIDE